MTTKMIMRLPSLSARSLLCLAALLINARFACPTLAQETADLRGYGKVTAVFDPERAEFTCESSDKADLLQGKLVADLLWDTNLDQRAGTVVDIAGHKALVYPVPSRGAIITGRLGRRVVVVGGTDASDVIQRAAREPLFRDRGCKFKPDNPYPIYLDFYDLKAIKIYTHAMSSTRGEGLESHWPFLQKFDLGGISYNLGGGMLTGKSPAPGILSTADTDFEVGDAERNHGMILPSMSVGGALPIWAANAFPGSIMKQSPAGIVDGDGKLRALDSYGMSRSERENTGLWSLRELMHRYVESTAVGGWQIYDGPGGIETVADYQASVDFSEAGLVSYREYLREDRKFSLETLGVRYFGDPNHFKSWDEVMPLDANAFFGQLDDSCVLLSEWHWQAAGAPATQPPPASAAGWASVTVPGSDEIHALPAADVFFRIGFDATAFLAKAGSKDVYLVCGKIPTSKASIRVWLNGADLGEQVPANRVASFRAPVVKLTGLLKAGANELVVRVPGGRFVSPFFLTPHLPEEYPSSSKTLNARYIDLKDWQFDRNSARHRDAFTLARGIDPDRPLVMAAAGGWEIAGDVADMAVKLGVAPHNTGREAFYQPWWPRLGRVAGFYGTSEPSATTHADITKANSLNRLLGWLLIDGDSAHILYWDIEDYIREERVTGWFTKNKRLLSLVGKSIAEAPAIVVFRSASTMRYSPEHYNSSPWMWDLGRGELNAAHYNWGYASEREVKLGLPPACKILVDSGSEEMDQTTIDSIKAFVSNGGTFIALHNTGRHDPIAANTWPVSQLTGCKVVGDRASGTIRFDPKPALFQGWGGREFTMKASPAAESIRLAPIAPDVQVLARWDDGSAALTSRTLGKGRVVCLGATFWRNAHDQNGVFAPSEGKSAFLERLFTDLGVERNSDASSSDLWIGDFTEKNGLEKWLIAFNTARASRTVNLRFRADSRPTEVRDLDSRQAVPFDYANGWVELKNVTFDDTATRIFAIKRADLVGGLAYWWSEKTTYWRKSEVPAVKDAPRDAGKVDTLKVDSWKFFADRGDTVSAKSDWIGATFDDSAWDTIRTGPWNTQKESLKSYAGTGLYRAQFVVPAEWTGSAIRLNLYSPNAPYVFGDAEFFVNGKRVGSPRFDKAISQNAHSTAPRLDLEGLQVRGENELAVKITGGRNWGGEVLSGFGGSVYLSAEKPLTSALDLAGNWTCVKLDKTTSTVSFPSSKARGGMISKDITAPSSWAGHDVRLRIDTGSAWLKGILVNGKLLVAPGFRGLGSFVEWNVTPWVKPGEKVRIELWGDNLPLFETPDPAKMATDGPMELLSARIGVLN